MKVQKYFMRTRPDGRTTNTSQAHQDCKAKTMSRVTEGIHRQDLSRTHARCCSGSRQQFERSSIWR